MSVQMYPMHGADLNKFQLFCLIHLTFKITMIVMCIKYLHVQKTIFVQFMLLKVNKIITGEK